jgi:hypothetical protein
VRDRLGAQRQPDGRLSHVHPSQQLRIIGGVGRSVW